MSKEMSPWFGRVWWGLVVVGGITLIVVVPAFTPDSPDSALRTLVWSAVAILLVLPLVSEISVGVVSLKKEIESLRSDVTQQILSLRTEVHNSVDVRARLDQHFHVNSQVKIELDTLGQVAATAEASAPQEPEDAARREPSAEDKRWMESDLESWARALAREDRAD